MYEITVMLFSPLQAVAPRTRTFNALNCMLLFPDRFLSTECKQSKPPAGWSVNWLTFLAQSSYNVINRLHLLQFLLILDLCHVREKSSGLARDELSMKLCWLMRKEGVLSGLGLQCVMTFDIRQLMIHNNSPLLNHPDSHKWSVFSSQMFWCWCPLYLFSGPRKIAIHALYSTSNRDKWELGFRPFFRWENGILRSGNDNWAWIVHYCWTLRVRSEGNYWENKINTLREPVLNFS